MCFIKGDWQQGLELLAEGSSAPLAAVARQDREPPSTPSQMLSVADAWWQLAEKANQDVYRQACQQRAVHWYEQAHALLPASLDRLHAQRRMEAADARDAGSPAASIRELAEQLNVDLQHDLVSLAAMRRPAKAADHDL